jgi:hypothetical protein
MQTPSGKAWRSVGCSCHVAPRSRVTATVRDPPRLSRQFLMIEPSAWRSRTATPILCRTTGSGGGTSITVPETRAVVTPEARGSVAVPCALTAGPCTGA